MKEKKKKMKSSITFLVLIIIHLLFVKSSHAEEIYIHFNKDKVTQKVIKKMKLYILCEGKEYELIRLSDSSFVKPIIPDSMSLKDLKYIRVKFVYKKECLEFDIYNILYNKGYMNMRIYRGFLGRKYSVIMTRSMYSFSPIISSCKLNFHNK